MIDSILHACETQACHCWRASWNM